MGILRRSSRSVRSVRSMSILRLAAAVTLLGASTPIWMTSAQRSTEVAVDDDDIGGVVSTTHGPEAGVWVIAETDELPTKFIRIVVTDEQGRYLLPDLPTASYQVFARGYGL